MSATTDPPPSTSIPPGDATPLELLEAASAPPISAAQINLPTGPILRFPPFPEVPAGVQILPFKSFKEHGILIFSEDDVEVDGLGIPTVPLRVPHDTDVRKTLKKTKPKVVRSDGEEEDDGADEEGQTPVTSSKKKKGKGKKPLTEKEKLDPVARALEQRRQRILMFQKTEWYNQWAIGEDLRGMNSYDPNMSPVDRIHIAATEFRTGRIWPPGYLRINYLWDQLRLYTGLLGSPPVWTRTDLLQPDDEDDDDDEEESDDDAPPPARSAPKRQPKRDPDSDGFDPARYSDEDSEDDDEDTKRQSKRRQAQDDADYEDRQQNPTQIKRKRVPPRTPYALFDVTPVPLSSDAQVTVLLRLAAQRRDAKLLKFLADPDHSTRVFLSWYLRHEGFVWTPAYLVNIPHLAAFFLAFLLRARVLPESERALRRAVGVAQKAIEELPRTSKLCKLLPDKMGVGAKGIWGARWEEPFAFAVLDDAAAVQPVEEETKEEALRRFEEDLKAANVQLMPADPDQLGAPSFGLADLAEESEEDELSQEIEVPAVDAPPTIQVMSPTSPGYVESNADGYLASHLVKLDEGAGGKGAYIEDVGAFEARVAEMDRVLSALRRERGIEEATLVKDNGDGTETGVHVVAKSPPLLADVEDAKIAGASIEEVGAVEASQNPIQHQAYNTGEESLAQKSPSTPVHTPDAPNWAVAPDEQKAESESDDDMNDWSRPTGATKATPAEREAKKQAQATAWAAPMHQPLMELFGMTVFPLKYNAGGRGAAGGVGVAERSVRKVRTVIPAGELEKGAKWRGVEEELVRKLARVVLAPWKDWDDGGIAPDYRVPQVQGPSVSEPSAEDDQTPPSPEQERAARHAVRYTHDPLQDDITVLVEQHVAELMSVGMGLAGTWVQLIPVRDDFYGGSGGRGRGRGRGRGGRGRGTGRGGSTAAAENADQPSGDDPDVEGAVPPPGGGRGTYRGRGRGRGGSSQSGSGGSGETQKEFTFWYIEDIYMAVPSFWTVGEEEPPLDLTELGEEFEMDD